MQTSKEHSNVSYRVRSPHRLVLVLFALVVNFLLYLVFSSKLVGMQADRAAEYGALAAFFVVAFVTLVFKRLLEE